MLKIIWRAGLEKWVDVVFDEFINQGESLFQRGVEMHDVGWRKSSRK
jgi:hypothetical protein